MSLTVASGLGTVTVVSLTATYSAKAHGIGGLLYVKYTKGDEDGVTLALSYKTKGMVSTDLYQHVSLNSTTRLLSPTTYLFSSSGNYRIPITWTCEETALVFTFAQSGAVTATGTISVDFREAD
jgi:hypothetical protein